MSEAERLEPLWGAVVWHSTPKATNPQTFVFESPNKFGFAPADRREALRRMVALFKAQGLNEITIYEYELEPLKDFEGGESGK